MSPFTYNVGYTAAVNAKDVPTSQRVTRAEIWQGVRRGARFPGEFAEHVQRCTVVSGSGNNFAREIVIGAGGVHASEGQKMIQDVVLMDDLYLLATTRDSNAKTTMMVTYGCNGASHEEEELDPYLSLFYELVMNDKDAPAPGSKEAQDIVTGYRTLAKRIVGETIELVRSWKKSGRLASMATNEVDDVDCCAH